jgi:hypothetical protein
MTVGSVTTSLPNGRRSNVALLCHWCQRYCVVSPSYAR